MEERDAFELQLRALKAEVESITRRLAGAEGPTAAAEAGVPVEPALSQQQRRGKGGANGREDEDEEEQPRGASPSPIPIPMVHPPSSSSTLRPGVVVAPRSPPKIVRRHPPPRSNSRTQQPTDPSSGAAATTRRPRPSSAPPLMEGQGQRLDDEEEEEKALMAWVAAAKTPAAQLRRAGQALTELLRERDAALQGLQQAQHESVGLRARVRELEGLEQDLATLKIALESSERIRLQQKSLLDLYKAQQHQPREQGADASSSSAPHDLNHHDVPAAPSTPAPQQQQQQRRPPAPAVADAAWVNQFFLDYSLKHPDRPQPPAHSDTLLMTPAVVSSPGSAHSSANSRQKKAEAARLARRLRGEGTGAGAGANPYASGGGASATAASLRRASAAGLVLGAGGQRPELSEESLRWRRYRDGVVEEEEEGGSSRRSARGGSWGSGGKQQPSAPPAANKRGLGVPGSKPSSLQRAVAGARGAPTGSASSSANTSAASLASAAGVHPNMNGPTSAFAPAPAAPSQPVRHRRKAPGAATAAAIPAAGGLPSPFDSPATTTSGTRPSSASSLATKGHSPGARASADGKARRIGGSSLGDGRSKREAARLWS